MGWYDNVIMFRFRNGLQGIFEPPAQLAGAGDNPFGVRGTARRREVGRHSEGTMKNPLDSLWGTVIAGVLLTVVLYAIARFAMGG